jgi:hypothetical protein
MEPKLFLGLFTVVVASLLILGGLIQDDKGRLRLAGALYASALFIVLDMLRYWQQVT